jgi:hypothetical protein
MPEEYDEIPYAKAPSQPYIPPEDTECIGDDCEKIELADESPAEEIPSEEMFIEQESAQELIIEDQPCPICPPCGAPEEVELKIMPKESAVEPVEEPTKKCEAYILDESEQLPKDNPMQTKYDVDDCSRKTQSNNEPENDEPRIKSLGMTRLQQINNFFRCCEK